MSHITANDYSESGFFGFIKKWGRKAGREILKNAFILHEMLKDPDVPRSSKLIIMGALAYLILPIDAIPDFLPVVGLTDDALALVTALAKVASNCTDAHKARAEARVRAIFGD